MFGLISRLEGAHHSSILRWGLLQNPRPADDYRGANLKNYITYKCTVFDYQKFANFEVLHHPCDSCMRLLCPNSVGREIARSDDFRCARLLGWNVVRRDIARLGR
jgi:hypothetical protein